MLDLQLLDLVDPNKEMFISREPDIQKELNTGLSSSMNKANQTMNAFEQAKSYYDKTQSNPIMAFIEQNYKPRRDEEKEQRLKQIAGVNALGQGLTNVIDAIYAKKGAKVPIRKDNTTDKIMQALAAEDQKYNLADNQYKNMLLSQMIRDIDLGRADALAKQKAATEQEKWKTEVDLKKAGQAEQVRANKAREKLAAEDKAKKEQEKVDKTLFPVTYGFNKDGTTKTAKLKPNEFNDVISYAFKLDNPDYNKRIQDFIDGKANKDDLKGIVNDVWDQVFEVNENGEVVKKRYKTAKGGYILEDTYSPKFVTFKVGNKIYNIPSNEIDAFLKDFPNAVKQ